MRKRKENFVIRITEVDHRKQLTVPSLVNLLQEIAWNHAHELGFSVYQLLERDLTWVLVGMDIRVEDLPRHGEELTITTWPSGIEKLFVYRDFELHLGDRGIGRVLSSWLVFDTLRRTYAPVPDFISDTIGQPINTTQRVTRRIERLSEWDREKSFQVRLLETDVNQHVNNSAYFQWLMESIPMDFVEQKNLRQLEINFKAESRLGDQIQVRTAQTGNQRFLHQIVNQENRELIRARSNWA